MRIINSNMVIAVTVALWAWTMTPAHAGDKGKGNPNPKFHPPNSNLHGKSYVEWLIAQSEWLFNQSPVPGEECVHGSSGQPKHVWFLGSAGVPVQNCTVPKGKSIFVPVSGTFCSISEGAGTTEEELRQCATSWEDLTTIVTLEADGVPIESLERYRFVTPLFEINWPEDNIAGLPAGPDSLVSDVTFVILKPLSQGQHTIHRHVEASDGYVSDVVWNITVE